MSVKRYGDRIAAKVGDITLEVVDAVVNAANSNLMGGGGVDAAIHRAGGNAVLEECKQLRSSRYPDGLPNGEAAATAAGNLPAKWVVHTVGPIWKGGGVGEPAELRNCYLNSLKTAVALGAKTIAFPSISTGAFGYPPDQAAAVASKAVWDFLAGDSAVTLALFMLFDEKAFETFTANAVF